MHYVWIYLYIYIYILYGVCCFKRLLAFSMYFSVAMIRHLQCVDISGRVHGPNLGHQLNHFGLALLHRS